MKQYTATTNDDGVRLSRFVQSVTRDFPTSLLPQVMRGMLSSLSKSRSLVQPVRSSHGVQEK